MFECLVYYHAATHSASHLTKVPGGGHQPLPKNIELLRLLPSLIREPEDDEPAAVDSTVIGHSTDHQENPRGRFQDVEVVNSYYSRYYPPTIPESFNARRPYRKPNLSDELAAGGILASGESLVSRLEEYTFSNQEDGNLRVYNEDGESKWHSGTARKGRGDCMLLKDGNLVFFDTEGTGKPVWASMSQGTVKAPGPYKLFMQDDGNLVIYGANSVPTWAIWSDRSSGIFTSVAGKAEMPSKVTWLQTCEKLISRNGKYTFVNQGDGNLVIYNNDGLATWASMTRSKGAGNLYMQTNGDLVLYNTDGDVETPGAPIWSSGTANRGNGPFKLVLHDDGKLVIYDSNSKRTWASHEGAVWRNFTKSELHGGNTLRSGESLVSASEEHTFINQDDGNLVTYDIAQPTWASGTGPGRLTRGDFTLLSDGNLVLRDTQGTGKPVWASMSQGIHRDAGPYRLIMQDDANLVIYGAHDVATWATRTLDTTSGVFTDVAGRAEMPSIVTWLGTSDSLVSRNGMYTFVNQRDGNLVIYTRNRKPIWTSNTYSRGSGNLYMQRDGNLVLYNTDGNGRPIWASNTYGRGTGPYTLIMQNDGNLVIHDALHNLVWASNSVVRGWSFKHLWVFLLNIVTCCC
ncbi:unnamed protein product [Calypogeia fissa]